MKPSGSIRFRMMVLFCAVVGLLLAFSYTGFYFMFKRVVESEIDEKLQETPAPIIAHIMNDPEQRDIERFDIPGQFFELIDSNGNVLQRSRNLHANLPIS